MEKKGYYLGISPNPKSVGWAVTDKNYNLLKYKKKDLWGVRKFEEAETSESRRLNRCNRRLHQREVARIGLVKSYFDEAIRKVDPNFMIRLENSKYHKEDKNENVRCKYSIFNDADYTDVEYFKEYPTVYHLRQELIHNFNPNKHDVRFVFLAILNIFKNRGHFLTEGLDGDAEDYSMQDLYSDFVSQVAETMGIYFPMDINISQFEEILSNRYFTKTHKSEELNKLFGINKKNKDDDTKVKIAIINAICGKKVNLKNIFEESLKETDEKIEISFGDADYDEKINKISEIIGFDNCKILELMKNICDKGILAGILHGFSYLSDARVQLYNKHHEDVSMLKQIFKEYFKPKDYRFMFNSTGKGSYSAYVGSYNYRGVQKSRRGVSKASNVADLYKKIKEYLLKVEVSDERIEKILMDIESESFLPKQKNAANRVIPNQVHLKELKKILSNAEEYYSFLKEKDEYGLTISERIIELFRFQIPYYIGPVTERSAEHGGNGWVVRKQEGRVYPWNFSEMINEKETSKAFITRMIKNCTYINEEKVLPKASLEYEAFKVLNEINNLKIDGSKISVELKQDIYNDLFKLGRRVTRNQLARYLKNRGLITSDTQLSGIDVNINNYLSSYGKFSALFGEDIDTDNVRHMVENIIRLSTIYGEAKKILRSSLIELYGDKLTPEQIKIILSFKFKDWGSLSKEFLELSGYDRENHTVVTLIRAMWENNANMMEIINSDLFTFKEVLMEKQNKSMKSLSDFDSEDLKCFYFSSPVRKMIWQTILIVKELTELLGAAPEHIFIESSRGTNGTPERTISRKHKFLELYKNEPNEDYDWVDIIEKADEDGTLRSKKMYLFLSQKGRCMYTGKRIELKDLFNSNIYDIDHIYPKHYAKDDNINNNLVLVDRMNNRHKEDIYPIEDSICDSQKDMWLKLYKKGFINEEKYNRLISKDALTDEQKASFISRQLVEMYQGEKGIAEIIKGLLPETAISYTKSSNISDFRNEYDMPKCRLLNEFYHARDAYLSIVVGNVYYTKFTNNPLNFIRNDYKKDKKKHHYNLNKMFHWDVERNGKIAWIAGNNGTIETINKTIKKNTPMMTRHSFQGHGKFSDATIYSAKEAASGVGYIPMKSKDSKLADVTKYGGLTSVTTAYFILVEHKLKKNIVRTLEAVPLYLKDEIEKNPKRLEEYCEKELGLIDFSVRIRKIKIQSLVKINGYFAYITGRSGSTITVTNAVNMCLDSYWNGYVKKLEKYIDTKIIDKPITEEENIRLYEQLEEKFSTGIFGKRPTPIGNKLIGNKEKFISLSLEQQCDVLCNILQCSTIGGRFANLELLGEPKSSGVMSINKKINSHDSIYLINQSITGVYENSIDLLTV